jgi:glyoxylase-like metal-dependent hydrolase (beta-lactamase superfamily II)
LNARVKAGKFWYPTWSATASTLWSVLRKRWRATFIRHWATYSRLHRFDTGSFNWYLISQGDRLTLVAAGFPGHYPIFLNGLHSLGYSLKDLEAIILTHAHADHTGFAEKLRRAANVPVFIHRDDLAASRRPLNLPWYGLLTNVWRPYGWT